MTTNADRYTYWNRGDHLVLPCADTMHGLRAVGQWSLTDREFDPSCGTCEKRNPR